MGYWLVVVFINMAKSYVFCRFYTFYLLEIGSEGLESSGRFCKGFGVFVKKWFTFILFFLLCKFSSELSANFFCFKGTALWSWNWFKGIALKKSLSLLNGFVEFTQWFCSGAEFSLGRYHHFIREVSLFEFVLAGAEVWLESSCFRLLDSRGNLFIFSWEFRGTMILDNQGVTTENGNFVGITFFENVMVWKKIKKNKKYFKKYIVVPKHFIIFVPMNC